MTYHETEREGGAVTEWERDDGWTTIRCRRGGDGAWVVRLDRLTQAPDGSLFREKRVATRADAEAVVAAWRESYDEPIE